MILQEVLAVASRCLVRLTVAGVKRPCSGGGGVEVREPF